MPCSGISLPTKSARKRSGALQAGREEPFLGAHEADGDTVGRETAKGSERASVLLCVGDDEVGAAEGEPVESAQHARCGRARREAPAVLDKRLAEGHSGLKTSGRPRASSRAAGRSNWPG